MAIVYFNGRYMDDTRARVPVSDPALGWGIGLFEVMRGYRRQAFRLEQHVDRLRRSAEILDLDASLPPLAPVIGELFARNGLEEGAIRLTVTGGGSKIVSVGDFPRLPTSAYRKGVKVRVAPWRRDPRAPLAGHKTLNYYANMIDRRHAGAEGAIDTIVLGLRGEVLEGTRCNVFAVHGERIVTPSLGHGILPGVTRQVVLELARAEGIELAERRVSLSELVEADEVFVTSTLMEVVPVRAVGEDEIDAPGDVTRRIRRAFSRATRAECPPR
jgi:branched-subunit amino acid aminotransferase/4-amino-4-deoxychorismate lyase